MTFAKVCEPSCVRLRPCFCRDCLREYYFGIIFVEFPKWMLVGPRRCWFSFSRTLEVDSLRVSSKYFFSRCSCSVFSSSCYAMGWSLRKPNLKLCDLIAFLISSMLFTWVWLIV